MRTALPCPGTVGPLEGEHKLSRCANRFRERCDECEMCGQCDMDRARREAAGLPQIDG